MAALEPRVHAPGTAARGEIFEVRTLISHPMETGLRMDENAHLVPRKLINRLSCHYNDIMVFSADLHESVAANPYLSFHLRAGESGWLRFIWEEDGGSIYTVEKPITVLA